MLLGSEKGDVMIVHNGDLRGSLSVEPEAAIRAIVPTSKVHHPAALAQLTVLRRTRVQADTCILVIDLCNYLRWGCGRGGV